MERGNFSKTTQFFLMFRRYRGQQQDTNRLREARLIFHQFGMETSQSSGKKLSIINIFVRLLFYRVLGLNTLVECTSSTY